MKIFDFPKIGGWKIKCFRSLAISFKAFVVTFSISFKIVVIKKIKNILLITNFDDDDGGFNCAKFAFMFGF